MAYPVKTMLQVGDTWWWFPAAEFDLGLEFECRADGRLFVHNGDGRVLAATELTDSQIERMQREELLADLLQIAIDKLRSGDGWNEATTADVLREILHVYPRP